MKKRCNQCWQLKDLKGYKNCEDCRARVRGARSEPTVST